jgi:hypothetical protein
MLHLFCSVSFPFFFTLFYHYHIEFLQIFLLFFFCLHIIRFQDFIAIYLFFYLYFYYFYRLLSLLGKYTIKWPMPTWLIIYLNRSNQYGTISLVFHDKCFFNQLLISLREKRKVVMTQSNVTLYYCTNIQQFFWRKFSFQAFQVILKF